MGLKSYFGGFETKTGKIIYLGIVAIIPAFVLILLYIYTFIGPSSREIMTQEYLQETAHGVVDSVYNDLRNHNTRMVILNDKIVYEVEDQYIIDIEKGDSISKSKGSFILEVFRKPNTRLTLDYRTLLPKE
jgi:hypothetical protein